MVQLSVVDFLLAKKCLVRKYIPQWQSRFLHHSLEVQIVDVGMHPDHQLLGINLIKQA